MIEEWLKKEHASSAANISSILTEALKGETIKTTLTTSTNCFLETHAKYIVVMESGNCFWFLSNGAFGVESVSETKRLLETVLFQHKDVHDSYVEAEKVLQNIKVPA
jgi:hypothetical protein